MKSKDPNHPENLLRSLRASLLSQSASGSKWVSVDSEVGALGQIYREAQSGPAAQSQVQSPARKQAPRKKAPPAQAKPKTLTPVIAPSASIADLKLYPSERSDTLSKLAENVAKCDACGLCEGRTQTVFSRGNPSSPLMFIGEKPSDQDDADGLPCIGPAGKLLDDIIVKGMGYKREDVFVANVLKCRTPSNRTPEPTEIEACRSFLEAQIAAVDPIVIVALGRFPAQLLLESQENIGKLRGRIWDKDGRHILCTYHPSYLLRNPSKKGDVWKDVQLVMDFFGRDKPLPMRDA